MYILDVSVELILNDKIEPAIYDLAGRGQQRIKPRKMDG